MGSVALNPPTEAAGSVAFDNAGSGLDATDVQSALEELAALRRDVLFVPAELFRAGAGAAAYSYLNVATPSQARAGVWLLDAATNESLLTSILFDDLPDHWTTFDIFGHFVAPATASGDVVARCLYGHTANGAGYTNGTGATALVTFAAGAEGVRKDVELSSDVPVSGLGTSMSEVFLRVDRVGTDAADTLAIDMGFRGITLRKVT